MKLLDCTLRDGGYYTNWDFDPKLLETYLRLISRLPVDYVEIGYRNPPAPEYHGQLYYSPLETLSFARTLLNPRQILTVMLDAKVATSASIRESLNGLESLVGLVRLAVDPGSVEHAIPLVQAISELGFPVAVNLMYLSRHEALSSVLAKLEPFGASIRVVNLVDSFGACFPDEVFSKVQVLRRSHGTAIGFHGHDNASLAFANTLKALEAGAEYVDSTMCGMGRGAGNLRTELMLSYLHARLKRQVDLSVLGELVELFLPLKETHRWGAEFPYVVSGMQGLPQKELMEWLSLRRYSLPAIISALDVGSSSVITESNLSTWASSWQGQVGERRNECMVVGGGGTVAHHREAILAYIKEKAPLVVHSSPKNLHHFLEVKDPQVLCLPGNAAASIADFPRRMACIVAAPPRMKVDLSMDDRVYEVEPIYVKGADRGHDLLRREAPLSISLAVAIDAGCQTISLVGFDGYDSLSQSGRSLVAETQQILDLVRDRHPTIRVRSLLPTRYRVQVDSVYVR